MNTHPIRLRTVQLIDQFLRPFSTEGVLTVAEHREVVAQLKHLATKGTPMPPIQPRLINQREAAEILGVSLAGFKKQEATFPFSRRMIGSSVRYRNLDVFRFAMSQTD